MSNPNEPKVAAVNPNEPKAAAPAPTPAPAAPAAKKNSETSFDPATGLMTVTTSSPDTNNEVTLKVELGKTVAEAVAKFTEPVVMRKLAAELMRNISNNGRAQLKAGKSPAEVIEIFKTWKPGDKAPKAAKVAPVDALAAQLLSLSPEEQQAQLQALLAKAGINLAGLGAAKAS